MSITTPRDPQIEATIEVAWKRVYPVHADSPFDHFRAGYYSSLAEHRDLLAAASELRSAYADWDRYRKWGHSDYDGDDTLEGCNQRIIAAEKRLRRVVREATR